MVIDTRFKSEGKTAEIIKAFAKLFKCTHNKAIEKLIESYYLQNSGLIEEIIKKSREPREGKK